MDDYDKEERMLKREWYSLVFVFVCLLALVVVYLDVNVWNP